MRSDPGSEADGKDDLIAQFAETIRSLTEGELTYPHPFDVSSAAALASNIDTGDIAERLFEVTAQRGCEFQVVILASMPDHPEMPGREVINTKVRSLRLLTALLDGLIEELTARRAEH